MEHRTEKNQLKDDINLYAHDLFRYELGTNSRLFKLARIW